MNVFALSIVSIGERRREDRSMEHKGQWSAECGPTFTTSPRPKVVIVDDGRSAGIVILDPAQSAAIGSLFRHRGQSWVICGRRHSSRVLVAAPADRERPI
jgi:hypothetical protein